MSQALELLSGPLCLPKRAIDLACCRLDSNKKDPLSTEQAYDILTFINNLAISNSLVFDGTLPPTRIQETRDAVELLCRRVGAKNLPIAIVQPANTDDAYPDLSRISKHLDIQLSRFDFAECDEPYVEAHEKFLLRLIEIRNELRNNQNDQLARSLANEIPVKKKRFDGSKCVAALACGGYKTVDRALKLYERFPRDEGARITGALINRFRQFYLANLVSVVGGAYQPSRKLASLTEGSFKTFIEYVAEILFKRAATKNIDDLWRAFGDERSPPPVGLLILAKVKQGRGRPEDLVVEALRFNSEYQQLIKESDRISAAARLDGLVLGRFEAEFRDWERYVTDPRSVALIRTRQFFNFAEHLLAKPAEPLLPLSLMLLLKKYGIVIPSLEEMHMFAHQFVDQSAVTPSMATVQYFHFKQEFDMNAATSKMLAGQIHDIFSG